MMRTKKTRKIPLNRNVWHLVGLTVLFSLLTVVGVSGEGTVATLLPDRDRPNHNLNVENADVVKGAMGQKAWRLSPKNGRLSFTLRVDPEQQNYVTLRFWSEDSGAQFRLTADDGEEVTGFDHRSSGNIAPEQWYYTTRPLPRELTEGTESVRLRLKAGERTRNIYGITAHTNARFQPSDHVPETDVVEPYAYGPYEPGSEERDFDPEEWVDVQEEWAEWKRKGADRTAKYIMSLQRYAPDWRQRVEDTDYDGNPDEFIIHNRARQQWPGPMVGGFDIQWVNGISLKKTMVKQGKFIKKRDNGGPMRGVEVLASVYAMEGSRYEGDPKVLDRIAVALDFNRRAQGANGGFVDVHGGWVGGPDRGKGEGVLEGRMHRANARAVLLTYDDLKNEGLLDERVDDDANPDTPKVPRRKAISDLLHNSLTYLLGQRGHAPNQEMMNVRALAPLHRALELMGGYEKLDATDLHKKMWERIAKITGLKPYGSPHSQQEYWVSPKGISMEIGGMSFANYGVLTGQIAELADLTEDKRIHRRAVTAAEALSYFWYPVYHKDQRIDLRQQEAWSRRGLNVHGGEPAVSNWAILNNVPSHIRARQLQLMQGKDLGRQEPPPEDKEPNAITGYDPHGWNGAAGITRRALEARNHLQLFKKLNEADPPPLPHEKGHPDFAWVDPVSGAVAIKHSDQHVFMTLRSLDGSDTDSAGILDVTPTSQRRALIDIDTPHGVHELSLVTYGDLFLAVNAGKEKAYQVQLPDGDDDHQLKDLVSGDMLKSGGSYSLEPGESIAVYTEK